MTTHPQLASNTTTCKEQYSDHFIVHSTRMFNAPRQSPRFTLTRKYSQIDFNEMNLAIANDARITAALHSNDSDQIADLVIATVVDHLDFRAPLRRLQTKRESDQSFLSDETRDLI